jgi:F0F1-type ATP synthase membrane subunit b/b'
MNEYLTSIKAYLYDRTSSPLFGAFVLSWLGWNYKFVLVISSGMEVEKKINYISEKLYPHVLSYLGIGILVPFLTAMFFLIFYPLLAQPFYIYSKKRQKILTNFKIKIENDEVIDPEKAREIKLLVHKQKVEFEKTLERSDALISDLQSQNRELRLRLENTEDATNKLSAELAEKTIEWTRSSESLRNQHEKIRQQLTDAYREKSNALELAEVGFEGARKYIKQLENNILSLEMEVSKLKKENHEFKGPAQNGIILEGLVDTSVHTKTL